MNNDKPIITDNNGRDSKGRFAKGNNGRPKEKPQNWSNDIAELENYFATVKRNNGKRTFLPYLNRLQELKQVLTINSN